jgi:hypothetical protein
MVEFQNHDVAFAAVYTGMLLYRVNQELCIDSVLLQVVDTRLLQICHAVVLAVHLRLRALACLAHGLARLPRAAPYGKVLDWLRWRPALATDLNFRSDFHRFIAPELASSYLSQGIAEVPTHPWQIWLCIHYHYTAC